MQSLFEWALAIISSGGLGAAITYIFTFKAKQQQALAEAESTEIDVEHKKEDLKQDQYDFLQKTCDKYIKDYHTLENDFRKQLQVLRDEIDKVSLEKSKAILISSFSLVSCQPLYENDGYFSRSCKNFSFDTKITPNFYQFIIRFPPLKINTIIYLQIRRYMLRQTQ